MKDEGGSVFILPPSSFLSPRLVRSILTARDKSTEEVNHEMPDDSVIVVLACGTTAVQAATATTTTTTVAGTPALVMSGGGYSGNNYHWAYDDNAVSPLQSYAYGAARIIQSAGQYNANSAKAAIDYAYAARENMKNLVTWEQTYFDMRRMNREYRAAEAGPRPTAADLARYAQMDRPRRLGPSDLDVVTGAITWPMLLRLPELAADRGASGEDLLPPGDGRRLER